MTSQIDLDFDNDLGATAVNPLEPLAPTTGVYGGLFQPLFGTLSAENQQEVWVQFLQSNNLTDPPPTDAQTQSLFNQYASGVYKLLENAVVSQDNFTVNIPLLNPPTTGFYAAAFQSYFAGQTLAQQQKIWVQFLLNNNFTTTPPPEDVATEELFINFAATILDIIQNQQLQSPEEIKRRYIMAVTLDSLLKMLGSLQDSIGVESQNLILYGTWQQEYTKMMSEVPTYVGQPDSTVHAPAVVNSDTNFDAFTFGYDKLSVSNIADWWATNTINGTNQSFIMTSQGRGGVLNEPLLTITYTPQAGTAPGITLGTISWVGPTGSGITGSVSVTDPNHPGQPVPAVITFPPTPAQSSSVLAENAYATAFKTAFAAAWNGGLQTSLTAINNLNLTAINAVVPTTGQKTTAVQPRSSPDNSQNSAMELPWGYSYVVPSDKHSDDKGNILTAGNLSDANAKARGEVNAHLQNVIENIRSRRQVIQNLASALQTNLDQARQTVTNQSDLLDSILQSLTDLVKAIFHH